jgi:hypothetical protein
MISCFNVLKNTGKCCLFSGNVSHKKLPARWLLTKIRFGMAYCSMLLDIWCLMCFIPTVRLFLVLTLIMITPFTWSRCGTHGGSFGTPRPLLMKAKCSNWRRVWLVDRGAYYFYRHLIPSLISRGIYMFVNS